MRIEKNPYMGLKIVNSPWKEIEELKKPAKKSKKKKEK